MFVVFAAVGSLGFGAVFGAAPGLARSTATAAALLFVLGAVGKSAQLPLLVWLPDAMEDPLLAVTLAAAVAGIGMAYQACLRRREIGARLEPGVLRRAWYVDADLSRLIGGPGRRAASLLVTGDRVVVDGAVNGAGRFVVAAGTVLRRVQSGHVRRYALTMTIGAVALLGLMVLRAW